MLFSDLMEETIFSMKSNKSRASLTILGIVIGIGSVIAMISVGQGVSAGITSQIESLGTNLLVVSPGQQKSTSVVRGGLGSATTLTQDDSDAIASQIIDITAVAPTVSSRKQVTAKGANTNTTIYGIDTKYFSVKNTSVEIGTEITEAQLKSKSKVAILGPTTRDDLFGEDADPTGQKIRINSQEYTVIGVTTAKGGTGMGSSDDLIYIPLTTAQQYLTGNTKLSNINVQVADADMMTFVEEEISALLLARHNIADAASADFSIMNQADMLDTMSSVSDTLTLLLGAIAGISLLVGGIGIMNMMLTTVTERTREIGLRKSLGASKSDISNQFLAESVVLTFIGGIIGIILGWAAAWLITSLSTTTTVVTSWSIFLAVGISALIGIVFGYYPAHRAAKLDPIEALRYQ
jgi:putative ABC transport system permease protein